MYTDIQRHDVTQEEYFEMEGISNSDVSLFYKSPRLYKAKAEGLWSNTQSQPMLMGSAFDTLLLEPNEFERRFFVMPSGVSEPTTEMQRRLVDAICMGMDAHEGFAYAEYKRPEPKTWNKLQPWADAITEKGSRDAISWRDYQDLVSMLESVTDLPAASRAINESEAQVVFTATHKDTGLRVKGMLDLLGPNYVCDIKTTGEEVYRFPSKIYRYDYDRQMGHYCALAGLECGRFIAVERNNLNEADCFELSHERLEGGMKKMDRALRDMKLSKEGGFNFRAHFYTGGWNIL